MRKDWMLISICTLVLLSLSVLMAIDLWKIGLAVAPEKRIEHYTKVLLAVTSGLGAIVLISLNYTSQDQRRAEDKEHAESIERLKNKLSVELEGRIVELETQAKNTAKYMELEFQEDFRRRQLRYEAIEQLSREIASTTRAFLSLSSFRLTANTSMESLLPVLANALSARASFISARDELLAIRMLEADHVQLLSDYSNQLLEIFIDVRRLDPDDKDGLHYFESQVEEHRKQLRSLDVRIDRTLHVFLAPSKRFRNGVPIEENAPNDSGHKPNVSM